MGNFQPFLLFHFFLPSFKSSKSLQLSGKAAAKSNILCHNHRKCLLNPGEMVFVMQAWIHWKLGVKISSLHNQKAFPAHRHIKNCKIKFSFCCLLVLKAGPPNNFIICLKKMGSFIPGVKIIIQIHFFKSDTWLYKTQHE